MAKSVHLKVSDEQHVFMLELKKQTGTKVQEFILAALQEKIDRIKQNN